MRILYHHRTQAEDGQAVHVRALIRAFESLGHEVWEVGLVKRGREEPPTPGSTSRAPWSLVTRLPRFLRELAAPVVLADFRIPLQVHLLFDMVFGKEEIRNLIIFIIEESQVSIVGIEATGQLGRKIDVLKAGAVRAGQVDLPLPVLGTQ